jgi:hypothetical protein
VLCVLFAGDSVTRTGQEMPEGIPRHVVLEIGKPTGAIARALPFAAAADAVEGWFQKDPAARTAARPATEVSARGKISPADFDRRSVQVDGPAPKLARVLVTGDSMSMPLDVVLARSLVHSGVEVTRDPRLGTGISKSEPVDWLDLAAEQAASDSFDVVVVMLGANEGFPLRAGTADVDCCTADWAAAYARRVRTIATTYFDSGVQHVLWLALPSPRDKRRQVISTAVNAAVRVGLAGFGSRATVLATDELFTPRGEYRDAMSVDGRDRIVRNEDGIHLNQTGAELAADEVQRQLEQLYRIGQ